MPLCRNPDDVVGLATYTKLLAEMADEKTGINALTMTLYTTLVGKDSSNSEPVLLPQWASSEYDHLVDESLMDYHTCDYINNLDQDIAAVAGLLHHGLMLSFFVASGKI
jgi:hypothetical protein